jgi:hypothetical protein
MAAHALTRDRIADVRLLAAGVVEGGPVHRGGFPVPRHRWQRTFTIARDSVSIFMLNGLPRGNVNSSPRPWQFVHLPVTRSWYSFIVSLKAVIGTGICHPIQT